MKIIRMIEINQPIGTFCTDPDATFPTPVILAVSEDDFINMYSESILSAEKTR